MNMANSTRPRMRPVLAALLFTAGTWTAGGRLLAEDSDKLFKEWTADKPEVFAAYKAEPIEKGEGYRVRITMHYIKYARMYNGH